MNLIDRYPPERVPPLVTLLLVTYNQQNYILEALDSVLLQTYSPLEIIVSDDQSTDATFQLIQERLANYSGVHTVKVNQNPKNLGIGGHLNYLMSIARGRYIVIAAGDDISRPERVARIFEVFNQNPNCYAVYSNMKVLDSQGTVQGIWGPLRDRCFGQDLLTLCQQGANIYGCTAAWRSDIFNFFGPLRGPIRHEDNLIPFRALLIGQIHYIADPLVLYRRHADNVFRETREILKSSAAFRLARRARSESFLAELDNQVRDLVKFVKINNLDPQFAKNAMTALEVRLRVARVDHSFALAKNLRDQLPLLASQEFRSLPTTRVKAELLVINLFPSLLVIKSFFATKFKRLIKRVSFR